ncbi:TIGR00730 family Rossman fold protein [Malaciobacter molluscorum LMG 25693]|uniref:Cytokinin riboside 5'-monophosphate phosphoribohydrolase n=1 Tax=Malaciobacter molluscorum LMG 25693 TaxID=870501 RepID=A0A2G1DL78_9BACT|nr:TIGR00730 family Rossman fold protein [Malaciobacter molluscorum]AXX92043.1 putative Rossmann fold nucleotide-binding protein [Malaciobacter molluscorum LMG 25693]PHO19275.1 TIGR00730 family Rossman fold protein [Malaciobacter molluscorum LMG 25693]RXJ96463.1 TIGR00730 family Rossman fold protein [Malaciobacter molluscorum]
MQVAIYCGSKNSSNKIYEQKAIQLINTFKEHSFSLVYGGSVSGLMGTISNQAIKNNLQVTGVITYDLIKKEIANEKIKTLYKVNTIKDRKALMEELSDAFIAMPGGYGTFEEIFEVISNAQIGYHKKPCAFYNVNGYYNKLVEFLNTCVKEGFIDKRFVDMLIISDNPNEICERILNFKPIKAKWE